VAVARPRRFAGARVRLDGGPWHALPSRLDVEAELLRHNARARPRLLAAAALAMLPRAVATDALRERVGDGEGGARDAAAQIGGVALDAWLGEALPADTRSWTLLPAEVFCDRFRLPAGRHLLQLELSGAEPRRLDGDFDLEPGGLALLDLVTAAGPPGVEPDAEAAPESPLRAPDAGRNLTDTPEGRQALALLGALGLVDPPRRAAPPRRTGLPRRSQAHHGLQHGVQHGAAPPLVPGGSLPFPGVCHQFPGPSLPKE
jgi:hypothetical protein